MCCLVNQDKIIIFPLSELVKGIISDFGNIVILNKTPTGFLAGVMERAMRMDGLKCPFCGNAMLLLSQIPVNAKGDIRDKPIRAGDIPPHIELTFYLCINEDCGQDSIIAAGKCGYGYMNNEVRYVYPKAIYRHFPEYVPAAIRQDYEEAKKSFQTVQSPQLRWPADACKG